MAEPITMFLIGFTIGALTATFWDKIESWAKNALRAILRGINLSTHYVENAVYYLVKEGSQYVTKIAIAIRNITSDIGKILDQKDKEVDLNNLPSDVQDKLRQKESVVLMSSR